MDYREFSELYHYGIKGMHWGVRRYQNPDGTLTEEGKKRASNNGIAEKLIGIENKAVNKALRSTGKLRKAYLDMQKAGVKYKDGKYQYGKDLGEEHYKRQRALQAKAKRYSQEYINEYGNKPMSYIQSINAQKGLAVGTAVGVAVPIILPLWATMPLGYYVGSKMGNKRKKLNLS